MTSLHIDIETYCEIDLLKAGAYRYAEEVEVILFGFKYDDNPTHCVDLLKGNPIPVYIISDLTNPDIKKKAFNAAFEISQLESWLGIELPVEQWECTQVRTAMCGLPMNLEQAAAVLNLENQKDKSGSALIRYFCVPCKPTKANDFRTRNLPEHDPVKWAQFIDYCKKDVEAEWEISKKLSFYNISEFEHKQWCLDMKINKNGVGINIPFVRNAIALINHYEANLLTEAEKLTGLDNPKSVAQLKKWLFKETGEDIKSLNKESIPVILKSTDSEVVKRVLQIRQEGSKTSVKKYPRMLECVCKDGRIRGVHQYYGANRTGRDSHRLIQTGNFPRGNVKNIEPIRDLVMLNDPDWLEFTYGAIPDTLSSLLRSSLIPAPGKRFIISDYSAIEGVVIAWLAGEEWALEVFRTHGKIYEMTAAKMFNIPVESITKDSHWRQKGKISTLLLGYQGSVGALINGGALNSGLTEEELPAIVKGWRNANPSIVSFWYALQAAAIQAIQAIKTKTKVYVHETLVRSEYLAPNRGLSFHTVGNSLFFTLPSGRELVYISTSLEEGEYGERIVYWGVDQTKKKWCKMDTYSGKLAENCAQATARDILMNGLQNLDRAGYKTVLHVHDESVTEMPVGVGSLDEVNRLMLMLPDWAKDMPLKAAGEESFYYKK